MYYKLETEHWSDRGFSTQKLDRSLNLVRIMLELDLQVDTGTAVTRFYDGMTGQIIKTIAIREGSNTPLKLYGRDLHLLHNLFAKAPHSALPFTETASVTDSKSEIKFLIPIHLAASPISTFLEIEWDGASALGSGYTVDWSVLNGTYEDSMLPIIPHRIVPDFSKVGVKGTQVVDIPPEGALSQILIVSRANASPYRQRHSLTTIELKIEGTLQAADADNFRHEYAVFTGQLEETGVYLINLGDKPIIGNYSKLYLYCDDIATDFTVYFIFVSPAEKPVAEVKPTITKPYEAVVGEAAPVAPLPITPIEAFRRLVFRLP